MLTARAETWREDTTNADLTHPRNRVRHELVPYLERHFNPAARRVLARLSDVARSDEDALSRHGAAASVGLIDIRHGRVRIATTGLLALPDAVARRVMQQALDVMTGTRGSTRDDIDTVRAVATGDQLSADIRGVRVEHSGGFVVLVNRGTARPTPFRYDLPIPGCVSIPDASWSVSAEGPYRRRPGPPSSTSDEVEVEARGLGSSLVVRSRQAGDRIRPLGLGGQKKLQDLFVDRKVSREERDRVPVVTDRQGRIVWVAGHALGDEFRVSEGTNAVILLKLRRLPRVRR